MFLWQPISVHSVFGDVIYKYITSPNTPNQNYPDDLDGETKVDYWLFGYFEFRST